IEVDESKWSKNVMNKLAKYYLVALVSGSKEWLKYEKKTIWLLATGTENTKAIHTIFLGEIKHYGERIMEEESIHKYKPACSQQVFLDDTIGGGSSGRFEIEGQYTIEEVRKAILRIISEQSVLRTQYLKDENILIEYE